ncbi:Efflux RND transporter permease subunit [Candidatus Hepatincolaceae symbiont of Richtersius coronifer]
MSLSGLGIKRYIMAFMVAAAIILFGIVSYFRVGIDQFPDVDLPFITVLTTQEGTDAEVMDNTVTSILLDRLNGIAGIDTLAGNSRPSTSQISIAFDLSKDINVAFNEVQSKINQALIDLPTGIDLPQIIKSTSSDTPFLSITLTGNRTLQQLNEYATEIVKKKLETISGVAEVLIEGERDRNIRIELDIYKLASYGIGVNDVVNAFNAAHVQRPGGYIVGSRNELLLKLDFEFHRAQDIKNLVIKNNQGAFVKLSDVGTIVDGLEDYRGLASYNSEPSITLGVTKIAGSNAFSIEKEVMERLNNDIILNAEPGLNIDVTSNDVKYIKATVAALEEHLLLGVFLTSFIVYLFLRNLVSTLIISLAIPISLLGAVIVIYAFGYTFNTITLLALLLLIGVVVDDAIIVLENIYRKIEQGENPTQAAIDGSNQVVFAVLAATLSLVSIFGPVIFMEGIVGRFFQSFAVVVTFGVIISYFVSLFITPMLCARYLRLPKNHHNPGRFKTTLEKAFVGLERSYIYLLRLCLNHRLIVLIISLGITIFGFTFFAKVPVEFVAEGDKSQFRVFVRTPAGTNIYDTVDKLREVEAILMSYKEIKDFTASIGGRSSSVNRIGMTVNMVDIKDRDISQAAFITLIQKRLDQVIGASIIASAGSSVGGSSYKMTFDLLGTNSQDVYTYAIDLQTALRNDSRIQNVEIGIDILPQIRFNLDRDKAALLQLDSATIAQTIAVIVGGSKIGKFNEDGGNKRYDIRVKAVEDQITWIDSLNNIYLRSPSNEMVRLDNILKVEEYLGLSVVERVGSIYSASFNANPNVSLGEAVAVVEKIATEILPSGYYVNLSGTSKELGKTINNIIFVFGLSIILLYMVLASQFNSLVQPLVLLTSVPLAIIGGVIGLYISGFSLNIFSMIGVILLVGLVAKNAILMIDFTNELRQEGKSINEALLEACPIRLRPILMTSLTVILSMVPAALARGAGSESNASLSIVVIGGMISSTLLTLVVVPALYSLVEQLVYKINHHKGNSSTIN